MNYAAKDLFQLQSELIDGKIMITTNQAIDRVIAQIIELRNEMHREIQSLREEMNARFAAVESRLATVENRLTVVETKLGIIGSKETEIRKRLLDYAFKTGFFVSGILVTYVFTHFRFVVQ